MVDWQKKWFTRELVRPSPLRLHPAAYAGDAALETGALRGVPCAPTASSTATGAACSAAEPAPPAEVPEYIDA